MKEHRAEPRQDAELKAIVKVAGDGEPWKEITKVTTVSRTGVGFTLSRPVKVGRLVTMVLPMPHELRAYDHNAELYPVMALIQNCYKSNEHGEECYHVGAALIGKDIPDSFRADPSQNFRIDGMRANGLWKVVEVVNSFKARKHQRYWERLKITLTLLKSETKTTEKEATITLNIAAKGASVVSELDAQPGDKVKFTCKELDFFSLALVRNRKLSADGHTTLHLEFIDTVFPTEKIKGEFEKRARDAAGRPGTLAQSAGGAV